MNEPIKRIHIEGRRWTDRTYGNTYFASKAFINGKHVVTSEWQYGYGDHYIDVAAHLLDYKGFIKLPKNPNTGSRYPLWRYCDDNDIEYSYAVTDGLQRDMVAFSQELPKEQ